MTRYELEAWLGDDHGLTDDQVAELLEIASDLDERHPDYDNSEEREAALTVAYRLLSAPYESGELVKGLGRELLQARQAERNALAALRQAATMLTESEAGFARAAGIDRMTVRAWLGKR
jgi:hypothetical protein